MPESTRISSDRDNLSHRRSVLAAAAFSVPLLALALSAVVFPFGTLFRVLAILVLFCIEFLLVAYVLSGTRSSEPETETDSVFDSETEEKLRLLEEAGSLFGNSLRLSDMFRLLAARASEIVPLEDISLVLTGPGGKPEGKFLAGSAPALMKKKVSSLAETAARTGSVVLRSLEEHGVEEVWAAIPLAKGGKVFAVAVARPTDKETDQRPTRILLEALAERMSPVIAASVSFDERESRALVDGLTGLPNGRALELVLQNRVAEAQRNRGEAALVVLAVDIKEFASVNTSYGHGTGDRVLAFIAEIIREQLRKMDFLARTEADEFLAVLPASAPPTAGAIIKRISKELSERAFELPGGERLTVRINSGSAAFGPGGESASELVNAARADRDRSKPGRSNQVLRFPTKHSN